MPSSKKTVLKDLYQANSVSQLNSMAEIKAEKTTSLNALCKSADKVFLKAQDFDMMNDEEMAYIFFMRYFNIISQIKKSPQYKKDKSHYDKLLGDAKSIKAITRAEKLQSSLVKRYEERQKMQEDEEMAKKIIARDSKKENQPNKTRKQVKPSMDDDLDSLLHGPAISLPSDIYQKLKVNHSSILTPEGSKLSNGLHDNNTLIPDLSQATPFLTAEQLYSLMKSVSTSDLLIFDVRPQKDYAKNHIHHESSINIPAEYLEHGVSVNNLDRRISERTRIIWCQRGMKNHVVILDKSSKVKEISPASKLYQFKEAIYRCDSSCSLRNEPLFLDGGFDDWLWHYPSLATKPELPKISSSMKINETIDVSALEFPEIPEEKKTLPTPPPKETHVSPQRNEHNPQVPSINHSAPENQGQDESVDSIPLNNEVHQPDVKNKLGSQSQAAGYPKVPVSQPPLSGHPVIPNNSPQVSGYPNVPVSQPPVSGHPVTPNTSPQVSGHPKVPVSQPPLSGHPVIPNNRPQLSGYPNVPVSQPPVSGHPVTSNTSPQVSGHPNVPVSQPPVSGHPGTPNTSPQVSGYPNVPVSQPPVSGPPVTPNTSPQVSGHPNVPVSQPPVSGHPVTPNTSPQVSGHPNVPVSQPPVSGHPGTPNTSPQVSGHPNVPVSQPPVSGHPVTPTTLPQVPGQLLASTSQGQVPVSRKSPSFSDSQTVNPGQHFSPTANEGGATSVSQPRGAQGNGNETTAGLPPGWEKCYDKSSNRVFYKDHNTHTTHWNLPNVTPLKLQTANIPSLPISKQPLQQQDTKPQLSVPQQPSQPTQNSTPKQQQPQQVNTSKLLPHQQAKPPAQTPPPPQQQQPFSRQKPLAQSPLESAGQTAKLKSSLRRSLSSPNLAKLDDNEPRVDRSSKPIEPVVHKPSFNRNAKPLTTLRIESLNPVRGGVGRGLTGLRNLGNTCYMNSVLQCLFSAAPLAAYFISGAFREDLNTKNPMGTRGELAEQFSILVRVTNSGQYKSISPADFKKTVGKIKPAFSGYDQQDSQEFLTLIMDKLHEDVNKITKKPYFPPPEDNLNPGVAADIAWNNHKKRNESIMLELFDGLFMSTVRCLTCKKESVTFETFSNLTLPLPVHSNQCTLKDCLKLFTYPEKMSGDDKWFCPKCKQHREAIKQLQIWRLPPILIIHLKRFQYDGMWRQKLQTSVSFPLRDLDMSGYVRGPKSSTYDLFSVSNHYGTMHGGHYTAFCMNSYDRQWYKFDDQLVTELSSPNSVVTSAGYLLFYTSLPFTPPKVF